MRGKLIVIEGLDSCGKATQSNLLYERLKQMGKDVMKITFPDYESDSSALVKMYLNGELSDNADDINPYAASSFYAVDRFASYKTKWGSFYEKGGIVIADRYTTSNMIHQASKIHARRIRNLFLEWLYEYEFQLLKLPVPDEVILLNMPLEVSKELMLGRKNKINGSSKKDIHESDQVYLEKTYENAQYVAKKYDWKTIFCVEADEIRTIENINDEILQIVLECIEGGK